MLSQLSVQVLLALIGLVGALGIIARYAVERLAKSNEKLTAQTGEYMKTALEDDRKFRQSIVDQQSDITVMLENHLTTLYAGQNQILERTAIILERLK